MKKLVFLIIALLAIVSLAGCGGGNGGTDNADGNGDGDGNGAETAQWAAYAFGDTVQSLSGGSGKVASFTMNSIYSEEGKVREFNLEGTYLGKVTEQIVTQKVATSLPFSVTTENVTVSLECHKIKHRVTVVRDETGGTHPEWADVTVWIPTGDFETTAAYLWIYPKMTYVDSDGHNGEWSYYLTEAMQNEMNNPPAGTTVAYVPVANGDFYGYDSYAFYGLYGLGWFWFQAFAEGGAQELKVSSWTYGGCSYSCTKGNKTIGGYSFAAWALDVSCTGEGYTGGYKGVFSPDLPLPIYLKVGSAGGGSSTYWENTLTDLELQ